MAFTFKNSKGVTYTLHRIESTQKNGQTRALHYFSRDVRPGALDALPAGYVVSEARTGMPVLKKA
jgi:hypothetical protein